MLSTNILVSVGYFCIATLYRVNCFKNKSILQKARRLPVTFK